MAWHAVPRDWPMNYTYCERCGAAFNSDVMLRRRPDACPVCKYPDRPVPPVPPSPSPVRGFF